MKKTLMLMGVLASLAVAGCGGTETHASTSTGGISTS